MQVLNMLGRKATTSEGKVYTITHRPKQFSVAMLLSAAAAVVVVVVVAVVVVAVVVAVVVVMVVVAALPSRAVSNLSDFTSNFEIGLF